MPGTRFPLRSAPDHRRATARVACLAATAMALACGGDGGGSGPVRTLAFVDQPPPTTEAFAPMVSDITVEIRDDEGAVVTDSSAVVTLAIGDDTGELLLHASGVSDLDPNPMVESRVLELVDVADANVVQWLEYVWDGTEPTALGFDRESGVFNLATRPLNDFFSGDPATGESTLVGVGTTDNFKGLAYETTESGRLLGVVSRNSALPEAGLYEIDPATGVPSLLGTLVPDQGNIAFFNGLAAAPDGTIYAAVALGQLGLTGRSLMSIDPDALTATFLCELLPAVTPSSRVAGLAVTSLGTIVAVTGDAANADPMPANTETLYTVEIPDPISTATPCIMNEVIPLGAGDDGEAITAVATQLRGTVSVAAVNGVATFSGLQVTNVGDDFSLEATAANATAATSATFDVTSPVRSHAVQFSTTTLDVTEGTDTVVPFTVENEGGGTHTHDVIVTISVGSAAGVAYADDVNGTEPDTDFDYTKYVQLTIPAGAVSADGAFTLTDDDVNEMDETVTLYMEDASLATGVGTNGTLVITIEDDDPAGS